MALIPIHPRETYFAISTKIKFTQVNELALILLLVIKDPLHLLNFRFICSEDYHQQRINVNV